MKNIWKFPLYVTEFQFVAMPVNAQILTVQMQREKPYLWALVDSGNQSEPRGIIIHGTGHDVSPEAGRYVGTFQMDDGSLIFHAFEALK